LFVQLSARAVVSWLARPPVKQRLDALARGHQQWAKDHKSQRPFPGGPYHEMSATRSVHNAGRQVNRWICWCPIPVVGFPIAGTRIACPALALGSHRHRTIVVPGHDAELSCPRDVQYQRLVSVW
jgi:hypothetical protein